MTFNNNNNNNNQFNWRSNRSELFQKIKSKYSDIPINCLNDRVLLYSRYLYDYFKIDNQEFYNYMINLIKEMRGEIKYQIGHTPINLAAAVFYITCLFTYYFEKEYYKKFDTTTMKTMIYLPHNYYSDKSITQKEIAETLNITERNISKTYRFIIKQQKLKIPFQVN